MIQNMVEHGGASFQITGKSGENPKKCMARARGARVERLYELLQGGQILHIVLRLKGDPNSGVS